MFADLFDGNHAALGLEDGGCFRVNVPELWNDRIAQHLTDQGAAIGVYPLRARVEEPQCSPGYERTVWQVKWGCVDIDVKAPGHNRWDYETSEDGHTAAKNLGYVLAHFGVKPWIERTRSGGYHVWVFANQWIEARTMRRALLVACDTAGVPSTEVNPKSEGFADPSTLGNYVRLPYPGHLGLQTQERRDSRVMVVDDGHPLSLEEFVNNALGHRASAAHLAALAEMWVPPPPPTHVVSDVEIRSADDDVKKRLNGLAFTMLKDGPLGPDRSSYLFKLACQCAESGLTPNEAASIVTEADTRWTQKYVVRQDGDDQIRRTVERAYN